MANELRPGKRTVIERRGREFELPAGHTIDVYDGREGPETYVSLNAGEAGSSLFVLSAPLEEREDAVAVHLGTLMGTVGPGGWGGEYVPEPTGYPFPDEDGD